MDMDSDVCSTQRTRLENACTPLEYTFGLLYYGEDDVFVSTVFPIILESVNPFS